MSKKKPRKPLKVSIHGEGIDIEAKISNQEQLRSLANEISEAMTGTIMQVAASKVPSPEHDFDVIKRVVKIGDLKILEAIKTIVIDELTARQNAS